MISDALREGYIKKQMANWRGENPDLCPESWAERESKLNAHL